MPDKDEATPWWLWLQEQLRARDWTFADLCKRAGLDDSIGTRWKRGKLPMADNIRRVAAALDVPVMEAMLKADWITDGDLAGGSKAATEWWVWVERVLRDRGWTISEFARETGVEQSIASRWKRGNMPSLENIRRVADRLGEPRLNLMALAGQLTEEDFGPERLAEIPDDVLMQEMQRRMRGPR